MTCGMAAVHRAARGAAHPPPDVPSATAALDEDNGSAGPSAKRKAGRRVAAADAPSSPSDARPSKRAKATAAAPPSNIPAAAPEPKAAPQPSGSSAPTASQAQASGSGESSSLRHLFLGSASATAFSFTPALSPALAAPDAATDGASAFPPAPRDDSPPADAGFTFGATWPAAAPSGSLWPNAPESLDDAIATAASAESEPFVSVAGGALWGAAAAQDFMRQESSEQLRENWVKGRRDARAAYKKRHQDAVRQQRLRVRRGGGRGGAPARD